MPPILALHLHSGDATFLSLPPLTVVSSKSADVAVSQAPSQFPQKGGMNQRVRAREFGVVEGSSFNPCGAVS